MAAKHVLVFFLVLILSDLSSSWILAPASDNYQDDTNYSSNENQYDTNYTDLYDSSNDTAYDYTNYTYPDYSETLNNNTKATPDGHIDYEPEPPHDLFSIYTDGIRKNRGYNFDFNKVEEHIKSIAQYRRLVEVLIVEIKRSKLNKSSQAHGVYQTDVQDMHTAAVEYLKNAFVEAATAQNEIEDGLTELSEGKTEASLRNQVVVSFNSLRSNIADQTRALSTLSDDLDLTRDESIGNDQKPKIFTDEEELFLDILNRKSNIISDVAKTENNKNDDYRDDDMENHKDDDIIINNEKDEFDDEEYKNADEPPNFASLGDGTDEGTLLEVDIDETSYNQLFEEDETGPAQDQNIAVLSNGQMYSGKSATDAENDNNVEISDENPKISHLSNDLKSYLLEKIEKIVNQDNEGNTIDVDEDTMSIDTTNDNKNEVIPDTLYDEYQALTNSDTNPDAPRLSSVINNGSQNGTRPYFDGKILIGDRSLFKIFDNGEKDAKEVDNNLINEDDNADSHKTDPIDEDSLLDFSQKNNSSLENDKTDDGDATADDKPFKVFKNDKAMTVGSNAPNLDGNIEDATEADQLSNNLNLLEYINEMSYHKVNKLDPEIITNESKAYETISRNLIDSFENYFNGEKDSDENLADKNLEIVPTYANTKHAWEEYLKNEIQENMDWNKQLNSDSVTEEEVEFFNGVSLDANEDLSSYQDMLTDKDIDQHQDMNAEGVFKHNYVSALLTACICLLVVLIIVFFGLIVMKKGSARRRYGGVQVPYAVMEKKSDYCYEKRYENQSDKSKVYDIEV